MKIKTNLTVLAITSLSVLSFAACGSSNTKPPPTSATTGTTTGSTGDGNSTGGTTTGGTGSISNPNNNGTTWTLSPLSPSVEATVNGTPTQLEYVVYNPNTFQIAAYSYDYFKQAQMGGWTSYPQGNFSYFAVTLSAAPKAGEDLTITSGINASASALGYQFTANGNVCTAADYLPITGGDLKINTVSSDGATITGTFNFKIASSYKSDSGTVTGTFTNGSVENAGTGVAGSNDANSCTTLK